MAKRKEERQELKEEKLEQIRVRGRRMRKLLTPPIQRQEEQQRKR